MRHETIQASIASRQERAAGRILEDEALRGDLADDEFQPLLDWALVEADRAAASTEGLGDAEADARIDQRLQVVRELVRAASAAVAAHAEGDAARRASELAFIGTTVGAGRRFKALARRLDAAPDLPGPEIAALIARALRSAPSRTAAHSRREKTP
jgi:hypothetical protein